MGWIAELFSDLVSDPTAEQQQAFDRELARLRSATDREYRVDDRVTMLEDDLARMLLLLHAVTEAMVQKGVVSPDDIELAGREIDLRDGKADGKLDPASVRPTESIVASAEGATPEEHLAVLEQQARDKTRGPG